MDYREKITPTPLNSKDFFHITNSIKYSKMVALLKQVKLHLLNSGSKKNKKMFISRQNFLKNMYVKRYRVWVDN